MFFPPELSGLLTRVVNALEQIAREMTMAREARERDASSR